MAGSFRIESFLPLVQERRRGHIEGMFAPYCEDHGSRVLLSSSSIVAVTSLGDGLEVWFRCHCGAIGVWRPRQTHDAAMHDGRQPAKAAAEVVSP